jgi:cyclase
LFTESGRNNSGITLSSWFSKIEKFDIGEVLVTSVDKDGMRKGPDLGLVKRARGLTQVPLLYSGGISKESDLINVFNLDIDGVVIGSALHYGNLEIGSCKAELMNSGVPIRKFQLA